MTVANLHRGTTDPTAGVSLMRRVYCPRCGLDKGPKHYARPGLCQSCREGLTAPERLAWAA